MKCPSCGNQTVTESVTFCTRCGERLRPATARRTALKQALVMIAPGLAMVPIWMFIGAAFPADDKFVESSPSTTWPEMVAWIMMWVLFIAAAARVVYSLVFDQVPADAARTEHVPELGAAHTFEPARAGRWRTTTDELQMQSGGTGQRPS